MNINDFFPGQYLTDPDLEIARAIVASALKIHKRTFEPSIVFPTQYRTIPELKYAKRILIALRDLQDDDTNIEKDMTQANINRDKVSKALRKQD